MSTPISNTLSEMMMRKLKYQSSFESQKRFQQKNSKKLLANQSSFQLSKQNSGQIAKLNHQRSQSQQSLFKPQIIFRNEEGRVQQNPSKEVYQISQQIRQISQTNTPNSPSNRSNNTHKRNVSQLIQIQNGQNNQNEIVVQRDQSKKPSFSNQHYLSSTTISANQSNLSKQFISSQPQMPSQGGISTTVNSQNISGINLTKSLQGSSRASRQINQDLQICIQNDHINNNTLKINQSHQASKAYTDLKNITIANNQQGKARFITNSPEEKVSRNGNRQLSYITNKSNKSIENFHQNDQSLSPAKIEKQPQRKYINITQSYLQSGKSHPKLNKYNNDSTFNNTTNNLNFNSNSQFPISIFDSQQQINTQASQTSAHYFSKVSNRDQEDNQRVSQIKGKLQQINIPQFLKQSQPNQQTQYPFQPQSSVSLKTVSKTTLYNNNSNQQIDTLTNDNKEQQIEMLLLTNKKLHNNERLALKKEIQEIQKQKQQQYENFIFERIQKDLQTYQVTHQYTCEHLIDTLVGTARDLANFKNPKIVIRSLEKNFGHLQKPLDFLSFDQVGNMKEILSEPYLKKLALACSKVEGDEVLFKPNKKLLDGLLEITSKLEERLIIYQKEHFASITNALLEKNQEIKDTEKDLEEKFIIQNKKSQFLELRENIDSKYIINLRHMETQFINSYKKNKDKFGNFSLLCKRNLNICKNIDGVVSKLKEVALEQQQQD